MLVLSGFVIGAGLWFLVRCVLIGIYTVDQNERAVKTVFGRAQRVTGGKTTLEDPISEQLRPTNDPHNRQRFVDAQNGVYERACAELRAGQKRGHWMWFVFPQLSGLGSSQMAATVGISSREEAVAYLNHPSLGVRLAECTGLVNVLEGRSIDGTIQFTRIFRLFACRP
jgi:uncharacterized protein (DUF1810 family)